MSVDSLLSLKCSDCDYWLGKLQGNWYVYPSPCICPQCGSDQSEQLKKHLLAQAMPPEKRGENRD